MSNIYFILFIIFIFILLNSNTIDFFTEVPKKLNSYELSNLKKGQDIMTEMLQIFNNLCRTNNLKYWCVGGTLIGAIRHKGWIPHDADIDLAMVEDDYSKIRTILQNKLPNGYWFQDKITDKSYKHNYLGKIRYLYAHYQDDTDPSSIHKGLQLDIFIFRKSKTNILKAPWNNPKGDIKNISKNIIFPLKELKFENINVYVPNNYKKYSIDSWGSFPPKELPLKDQYPHEGRISFSIPDYIIEKYSNLYPKDVKYIKYKNLDIMFPKNNELQISNQQVWVDHTGLTTKRPEIMFNYILSNIQIKPGMKILDIGCGCGEIALEFYIKFHKSIDYFGIDVVDKLLEINKINMKDYTFKNVSDFKFLNIFYDIIMFMGYGHSIEEYINNIVLLKNANFIILESHTGKNNFLVKYNKILLTKYKIIFDKTIKCGDTWALKERHFIIYKLI